MTTLLALVGPTATLPDAEVRARLEASLGTRPSTVSLARIGDDVVLGLAVPTWDEASTRRIATDGRYTVVAHAAVFYRDALVSALASSGERAAVVSDSAVELILAALRAWGWRCVDHLEGEYAFLVWDAKEGTLFAARDHAGSRALFYTRIGDGLAVASSLRLLRALPGCETAWNLVALAEDAADLELTVASETAVTAIERLPAGHTLEWRRGAAARVSRWWEIPIFEQDSRVPFEEAAEELKRLIADAVAERSDLSRGSAVMLSGGYDSPALYAAGNWRLGTAATPAPLRSVSFSHPPGDPGREDELIAAVTARWGTLPYFIPTDSVPASEPSLARAQRREEPFYHTYELWNRSLALGCRAQDARIAMNGNGGDPWFSTSPVFLADLMRQGRLLAFRREWHALWRTMNWYAVFKTAVQPNLSPWALSVVTRLRGGRPLADASVKSLPAWMGEAMRGSPELLARRRVSYARRRGEGHSAAERTWYLRSAFAERITALGFSICQGAEVELRTPFLDARIIRFAATRPRWESNSARQNKYLLRRSMKGLVPDEVLAPRSERTGLPVTYLDRTLDAHLLEARDAFRDGMLLAKLGIGDHAKLLDEIDGFLTGRIEDRERGATLVAAVQAEWWLRTFE
ncbi:MAG: asparagine synthase-related protein [Gemmatimonadota bacterium]